MATTEQLTLFFEGTFAVPSKRSEGDSPNLIRRVKLCGPRSKNGYDYDCFTSEVATLYEGQSFHINHGVGNQARTFESWYGTFSNVEASPTEKCFWADLNLLDAVLDDKETKKVKEAAQKGLSNCGMSHVVSIDEVKHKKVTKEGTKITGIKKVHSVDIVMSPATTNGIHEAENMTPTIKTAKDILLGVCRFPRETSLIESLGDVTVVAITGLKDDATVQEQVDACFDTMGAKVWNDDTKRADVLKAKKVFVEGAG